MNFSTQVVVPRVQEEHDDQRLFDLFRSSFSAAKRWKQASSTGKGISSFSPS